MRRAVIIDVVRTASGRGKPGGALADTHPADLLAQTFRALVARTGADPTSVEDVICGCVSQVNDQSLNIGRTAWLRADFPESVPATTVDRQCGSSQQALHFAAQGVMAGAYDIVVAGGVESMSRVPLGVAGRDGDPFGPLSTRYPAGLVPQGVSAEFVAHQWRIGRGELDEFAARSHERAATSTKAGLFDNEIVPVSTGDNRSLHDTDETVRPGTTIDALGALEPAFRTPEMSKRFPDLGWNITAGNSSPLTDGASTALIMSEDRAKALGLRPRATFSSFSVVGSDPLVMLAGVIPATHKVLKSAGIEVDDLDAIEVNEAFACVPLAWQREFEVGADKVNPRGGAIALGHPMGASGIRILATMVNHLEHTGGRRGLITMCEGGGMANATLIEIL